MRSSDGHGHAGLDMDVSIIIPTYNRLWSLPETISSCPSGDSIEIIVVDDGSTDGTWAWLQSRPDVISLHQVNQGKPAAANAGFARASGEYVRFLDSDDALITDSARDQLAYALSTGSDICVAGYLAEYVASGNRVLHAWEDCGDFLAQQLGECDSSHYSAYLFRRQFLNDIRHRPEFAFRDDRMMVVECAVKEPSVAVWNQPTLLHRHHLQPRTQFRSGSVAIVTHWQELQMYRQIAARLTEAGLLTDRRRAAMANNIWPLALRIAGHDRREGRAALEWLWSLYPGFIIPKGGINDLYRVLGVAVAQTLVNAARTVRNTGRATWRG
ncbi:glycosyltransferase family 2 protein [Sphingomonas bacterium]|uniref:glycosyltransferase family 2 protein n=1 Tax=Sphingomonas bacterium TaxID=1895847 RepID=UPI00157665C3|nr:glycosyltransferase family 2 protein [Sphingomonas bacterium]